MTAPWLLFALFAGVAAAGAFLAVRSFRGTRTASLAAAVVLAFFLALAWALERLVFAPLAR